jgi:transcription termination factor NusB
MSTQENNIEQVQEQEQEQEQVEHKESEPTENKLSDIKEPEPKPEPTIVVQEKKLEYMQIIELVKLVLSTNEKFDKLMSKAQLSIPTSQIAQVKDILNYLVSETNGTIPVSNIIKETLEILSDNKIELHEIPKLINVIHESIKNIQSIKITTNDVGILIKFILFTLIETKTIKISNDDYELYSLLIDSSMVLLNKSVEIKIPKLNKCSCF